MKEEIDDDIPYVYLTDRPGNKKYKNKIENGIELRQCNRCKEYLSLEHFGKRRNNLISIKIYYQSTCRICERKRKLFVRKTKRPK